MNDQRKKVEDENSAKRLSELRRQHLLKEINSVITFAEIRCLTSKELLSRIPNILEDPNCEAVIYHLFEIHLSRKEKRALFIMLRQLSINGDKLPSREKARVDRIVSRLVKLLPSNLANSLIEPFLYSTRKARRQAAYRVMREKGIREQLINPLMKRFEETLDQEILELIALNPKATLAVDVEFLLQNLKEYYWRMRVFESLIQNHPELALRLAFDYSYEFVHAVGRRAEVSFLKTLLELMRRNRRDLEFLSLCAWALGKLGARRELERVHSIVEKELKKVNSEVNLSRAM